jgi:hypothetical protein
MKEKLFEWFFDHQLKLAFLLSFPCFVIIFLLDFGWQQALLAIVVSLLFIFAGSKIYLAETSENWLKLSYAEILTNIVGGAFMLIGWALLVRRVFTFVVAAVFLRAG